MIPDNHRLGPGRKKSTGSAPGPALIRRPCQLGVINERSLNELRRRGRIVLAHPYCPDDEASSEVHKFVERGRTLYTRDIGFDPSRKPARAERFGLLGLPARQPKIPVLKDAPFAKEEWITSRQGGGKVFYLPAPVELGPVDPAVWNPYTEVLEQTGYQAMNVTPNDPALHVFSIRNQRQPDFHPVPLRGGGECQILPDRHRPGNLHGPLRGWKPGCKLS